MNQHKPISSKQWTNLNQLRIEGRKKLISRNRRMLHRSLDKDLSKEIGSKVLATFDRTKKLIENRQTAQLDELMSDFVVDYIGEPDNFNSAFVNAIMEFYETITSYRI